MSLSTFVTAIIGNGPIRDEFAHRVMVQSLMETPRFYLLHTLNPQLSWGELQLRGSAKGKLTKARVWSSSRLIFHQFWIYPVKLAVLFGLCLGLWASSSWQELTPQALVRPPASVHPPWVSNYVRIASFVSFFMALVRLPLHWTCEG